MNSEGFEEHEGAEDEERVHRAVFEVDVFFDGFDVADSELADDDGADAVADEDEGDGKGEGEGAEHAVNGEGGVDGFKIENFAHVATFRIAVKQFALGFFCVIFKPVRNKKCC